MDHDRRLTLLRGILAFSVLSTAIHYTHNFVEIDSYPDDLVPGWMTQVAIVTAWPLLTLAALHAYRLFRDSGASPRIHLLLGAYSLIGLTTPAHFLDGNPDVPLYAYATIFTDGFAGLLVAGWVIASMRASATVPPASVRAA
jgi:hypothetical protein